MLGRTFTIDEETRKESLIVLSYGAWQRRFGGDPGIVGRTVQLDGEPHTVIGVMPQRVSAAVHDRRASGRRSASRPRRRLDVARTNIVTIAQLADGVTHEQANAEIAGIVRGLARELPKTHQGWTGGILSYRSGNSATSAPRSRSCSAA